MTLTITIRTAKRKGRNYLGDTVRSLQAGGVSPERVHVFPTSPDVAWLESELAGLPVQVHVPQVARTPNANGVAQVSALDSAPADWLLMLEDDVKVCANFEATVTAWLKKHQQPNVHVFRFCAFGAPMEHRHTVLVYPLREQRGSQAIALRASEARLFAQWATEHHEVWRPTGAPFQNQRSTGFDKLVGYWALAQWPQHKLGYVSRPHFVLHTGVEGSMHGRTVTNEGWFRSAVTA